MTLEPGRDRDDDLRPAQPIPRRSQGSLLERLGPAPTGTRCHFRRVQAVLRTPATQHSRAPSLQLLGTPPGAPRGRSHRYPAVSLAADIDPRTKCHDTPSRPHTVRRQLVPLLRRARRGHVLRLTIVHPPGCRTGDPMGRPPCRGVEDALARWLPCSVERGRPEARQRLQKRGVQGWSRCGAITRRARAGLAPRRGASSAGVGRAGRSPRLTCRCRPGRAPPSGRFRAGVRYRRSRSGAEGRPRHAGSLLRWACSRTISPDPSLPHVEQRPELR